MTDGRGSQVIGEVASLNTDPEANASQVVGEVASLNTNPIARGSQVVGEVASLNTNPQGRSTQLLVQLLRTGTNPPPYVRDQSPAPSATDVSYRTYIELTVDDYYTDPANSGVDLTTVVIEIQVNGGGYDTAYTASAFVTPFAVGSTVTGTGASGVGYTFLIKPEITFNFDDIVDVRVTADDIAGAQSITTYQFTIESSIVCYQYEEFVARTTSSTRGYIDDLQTQGEAQASFQFWVKRVNTSATGFFLTSALPNDYQWAFNLVGTGATSGLGIFIADSATSGDSATIPNLVDVGNWHHIFITFDAGTVRCWLDNVEQVVPTPPGGWWTVMMNHGHAVRGEYGSNYGVDNLLHTLTSNFAVWYGTAMTPTEVGVLYNGGTPANLICAARSGDISAEPTFWWRLGDGDTWPILSDTATGPGEARGQDVDISVASAPLEDNIWSLDIPGDGLEVYTCPSCTQCYTNPPGSLRIFNNAYPAAVVTGPVAQLQTAFGGATELTLVAWLKTNVADASYGQVLNWGDHTYPGENKGFGLEVNEGLTQGVRFNFSSKAYGTGGAYVYADPILFAAGESWTWIAVTVDLNEAAPIDTVNFYKDNILYDTGKGVSGTPPVSFVTTTGPLTLGAPDVIWTSGFRGQYLQVGLYASKLSPADRTTLYNGGVPLPTLIGALGSDPVLSWQLDQDVDADQVGGPSFTLDPLSSVISGLHPGGASADCDPIPPAPSVGAMGIYPNECTIRGGCSLLVYGEDGINGVTRDVSFTGVVGVMPAGWTDISADSGAVAIRREGLLLDSGLTAGSIAGVQTPDDYDHFDVAVDVAPLFPKGATASVVNLAVLEARAASGATARVALRRGVGLQPEQTAVYGEFTIGGVTTTGGIELAPTRDVITLRIVRNGARIFGFAAVRNAREDGYTQLVKVIDYDRFAADAGKIRIYLSNDALNQRVYTRVTNFTVRAHATIAGRLLNNKVDVSARQFMGYIPAATVEEVGTVDVHIFSILGQTILTDGLRYVLPIERTLGRSATRGFISVQDPVLKDES